MKPTEWNEFVNIELDNDFIIVDRVLQGIEDEGFELIKPEEGLAFTNGQWHRVPTIHSLSVRKDLDWFLEHSLNCRVRGLIECPVHAALVQFFDVLEPVPGRYEIKNDGNDGGVIAIPSGAGR